MTSAWFYSGVTPVHCLSCIAPGESLRSGYFVMAANLSIAVGGYINSVASQNARLCLNIKYWNSLPKVKHKLHVNPQTTPHNFPTRGSLGIPYVDNLRKISRVIMASHCNFIHLATTQNLIDISSVAPYDPAYKATCFTARISADRHHAVLSIRRAGRPLFWCRHWKTFWYSE